MFLKGFLKASMMMAALVMAASPSQAATGKLVLNTQVGEEIRYLDPQIATGISSAHIGVNLFLGLYEYNAKNGEPAPGLAESYTRNETSTEWTFKIKKGYSWVAVENGKVVKKRPVTAHDFVYSFRRILAPKTASEYAYMLHILKNAKEYNTGKIKDATQVGVQALDDHTLKLTMTGSVPTLLQYLPHHAFHIVPKEPIEAHGEKWVSKENIWTCGPFAFKEWKLKDRITVVKNPFYPDAKNVQLDEVNFNFIGTYSPEAVRAFRAGKNDIDYQYPPPSEITPLRKEKTFKAARALITYYFRINVTKGPLQDPRVRKALALVVPRTKITKYVMKAGQIPTLSFVPNAFKSQGYKAQRFTNTRSYKARVAEAKKLLAEAGYPNGKGFPKLNYLYNTSESHKNIAVILTKTWKKELGIEVAPQNQEWKVYLNTVKNLDYDLARSGWVADMADPMNFLDMLITGGGNNNTGYSNPEYDKLISQARSENDLKKRAQIMQEAEKILMADLPVVPIFNNTAQALVQPYVTGFYSNKMDQHPLKHVKIDAKKRAQLFPNIYK